MSKKFWKWNNSVESADSELVIEGVISSESWWGDEATPAALREELAKHKGDLTVSLNSGGGDVFAGVSMYNALKNFDGNVTIRVDGLAASIASIIAMAGDKIIMSPGSMMMIHKPWTMAVGDANELDKVSEVLNDIEGSLLPIYTARTGKSDEEIRELLNAETWMTAEEAVAEGFADELIEAKKSSYSDAIKNLVSGQFAYSMSATQESMNSLIEKIKASEEQEEEETDVTDSTETADEGAAATEDATTEDVEETDEETETESESEAEVEETNESDEEKKEMGDENTQTQADAKLEAQINAAVEGIVAKALPAQPKAEKKVNETEVRVNFVNQIGSLMNKNGSDLKKFATEAAEMRGFQNAIADGENLWVDEVVRNDILKAYNQVGRVGGLVDRESITADTLKILVETAGTGFQPVALGAVKPTDTPVWTPKTFEPFEWAVIVPWKDGDQKRTAINIYNQIIQYVATEYSKLEDKIILTYAGGTVGSETRPASGLVPILIAANRDIQVNSYSSADVVEALAEAYGQTESDGTITLVANRKTWAQLATSLDGFDRPLFTVVGEQVSAGALGSFRVVMSSVLSDGDVVIGNLADYLLVTRGGLATLFSREAYIADVVNLFTQDASALRADIDITGGAKRVNSFSLLQFAGESS